MLTGIRYKASPTRVQAEILSQWIGCARVVWNAKCEEDAYLRTYARKYLPVGTYSAPDKSYSQYKTELTPWLNECPSQILRNSATIWHKTYISFFKQICGRPVRKTRKKGNYIWLTRELFTLEKVAGNWELRIGTDRRDLGVLKVNWHRSPWEKRQPNSIWIRVKNGCWTVSFSYEDDLSEDLLQSSQEHLNWLRGCTEEQLHDLITPMDRGVARPVQTHDTTYVYSPCALKKQEGREKYLRRCQRKLSRQKKGSKQRAKTQKRIARIHESTANVRKDFLHKTSRTIVNSAKVLVLENLSLKRMTRKAKAKQCPNTGQWLRNGGNAKSGLNKALLGVGLHQLEVYLTYKAYRENKPLFKIDPKNTSRECAACGHIHPENRKTQAIFQCQRCDFSENADKNAALVIRKRAIRLLKHSGTELGGACNNVLRPPGADDNACKTRGAKVKRAARGPSKKKAASKSPEARSL